MVFPVFPNKASKASMMWATGLDEAQGQKLQVSLSNRLFSDVMFLIDSTYF